MEADDDAAIYLALLVGYVSSAWHCRSKAAEVAVADAFVQAGSIVLATGVKVARKCGLLLLVGQGPQGPFLLFRPKDGGNVWPDRDGSIAPSGEKTSSAS